MEKLEKNKNKNLKKNQRKKKRGLKVVSAQQVFFFVRNREAIEIKNEKNHKPWTLKVALRLQPSYLFVLFGFVLLGCGVVWSGLVWFGWFVSLFVDLLVGLLVCWFFVCVFVSLTLRVHVPMRESEALARISQSVTSFFFSRHDEMGVKKGSSKGSLQVTAPVSNVSG